MKLLYDYDPTKKITLKCPPFCFLSEKLQERALKIAVANCPYGWSEEDMRDFGKWTFPNPGQLKLQVKLDGEDATRIFADPSRKEYSASDTSVGGDMDP